MCNNIQLILYILNKRGSFLLELPSQRAAIPAIPVVGLDWRLKMSIEIDNNQDHKRSAVATLAGGCFWCLEAVFADLKGVQKVVSGYAGGQAANPSYPQVCTGKTGHAEVVQVTYDPDTISYQELLEVFFTIHDPTTLNRQGADVGTQYRSAIFYRTPEEKATAEKVIHDLDEAKVWGKKFVTELTPFTVFYLAEDYHQNYFAHNPDQPYCQIVIAPKVAKFRKHYVDRLKISA